MIDEVWTVEAAEAEAETVEVPVGTEGARRITMAEVNERGVLRANEMREAYEKFAGSLEKHLGPMLHAEVGARLEEPLDLTCSAVTRVKRNNFNHTLKCQKLAGHDHTPGEGGHEWSDGAGRTTIWYGEAQKLPGNERYRFGLNPHWMMEGKGRKVMAGDHDGEW